MLIHCSKLVQSWMANPKILKARFSVWTFKGYKNFFYVSDSGQWTWIFIFIYTECCVFYLYLYLSWFEKRYLSKIAGFWAKSGQNVACFIPTGPPTTLMQPESPNWWDGREEEKRRGEKSKICSPSLHISYFRREKTTWNKAFCCGYVFANPDRYTL